MPPTVSLPAPDWSLSYTDPAGTFPRSEVLLPEADTASMDGTGIDVWVGTNGKNIDAIICIVDLMKRDSEIKILIGCTEEEKKIIYETHNETQYMKGILIRR